MSVYGTPAQFYKFAVDAGATRQAAVNNIRLMDRSDGLGPFLAIWTVPGIAAPANAGQLPDASASATWWNNGISLKRQRAAAVVDSDNLPSMQVLRAALQIVHQVLSRVQADLNAVAAAVPSAGVPQRPIRTWQQLQDTVKQSVAAGGGEV